MNKTIEIERELQEKERLLALLKKAGRTQAVSGIKTGIGCRQDF